MINAHRRIIEQKYRGKMTVFGFAKENVDGQTLRTLKETYTDVPCYLKRSQVRPADSDGMKSNIDYDLKIMCAPGIDIGSGSRIVVNQDGMTREFKYTGEAFKYPTHQEIMITRWTQA